MILQTERLYLREMTEQDLPNLRDILQDEKAMAAYEHAFSEDEVTDWLQRQLHRYRQDGFGLWAMIRRDTDEMVGQCGSLCRR